MSRFSHTDIVIELSEICRDLVAEIRQQLNYYRASVYKDETSRHISYKVEKLRVIVGVIHDEVLAEAFRDHDAEKQAGAINCIPGECSFSSRTTRLLESVVERCDTLIYNANHRNLRTASNSLAKKVQRHRREILSACRQGTRQWAFFQTF